ncbi:MAG: HK97 gp10 family phage protein [Nocardioidaceae bacterium]
MARPVAVRVEGLSELRRALKELDTKAPTQIRKALNEGSKIVVDAARPTLPEISGNLAASLRPSSTQREGRVTMGRADVPYAGWVEFGGKITHAGHDHIGDHTLRRPFIKQGRYLFPAAERKTDEVIEVCDREISELIARTGLG